MIRAFLDLTCIFSDKMLSNNGRKERMVEQFFADWNHELRSQAAFIERVSAFYDCGQTNSANKLLLEYWSVAVPKIFKPNANPTDLSYDEQAAKDILLVPLMHILCGAPGMTFEDYAKKLNITRARPGQICGRLFRSGEPTYSCRECATDPTCVMCCECFLQSEHKLHKYKMHASAGSGYCDCGDSEAWKRDAYCLRHKPIETPNEVGAFTETTASLSKEDEARMSGLLICLLQYAVELLCWDYCDILPPGLNPQQMTLLYQTMLFNDESHTYDQVIKALTLALECDEERAMFLATVVDREGRSSVRSGGKEDCERSKVIIQQRTTRDSRPPLIVETMDSNLVAHQQFAIKLLHWLTEAISSFPPLLAIASGVLMRTRYVSHDSHEMSDDTLVTKLMKRDFKLWKSARSAAHELFMGTVLMDPEVKKDFAKLFVGMYPDLMHKHIEDDHEHCLSVTSLTVQIFTVPTIAKLLIADENALCIVIRTFLAKAQRHITSKGRFSFQRVTQISVLRRGLYVLHDAKYLLTVPPAEEEWTDPLRSNFRLGFTALLDILLCMQGMDEVVRQVGQHQEWEPEWETAFNIQIRLSPILSLVQRWTSSDKRCLVMCFNETMQMLYHYPDVAFLTSVAKCGDHQTECIVYDVSRRPVSIHLPLSRMLAGLYLNFTKFGLKLSSPEVNSADSTLAIERLIELPLRTLVMIAQTTAGMWRRNGYALVNQIHNYGSSTCRSEMFDKDILMMQIGAANMEPNEFVIRLLDKFTLLRWAAPNWTEIPNTEEESIKQTVTLAEEFLHLLLIVTGERWVPGVGDVTREDEIRREVIHILCKGPTPYSKLDKNLPEDHLEKTGLENVIRNVADFRQPSGTSAGVFELKQSCKGEYNSFFYHYSKIDFSKAEEIQRRDRRDDVLEIRACPPPLPPPFTEQFSPIVDVLACDITLQILTNILRRAKVYDRLHTDGQLHRALHLIGLALREEVRQHDPHWRSDRSRKATPSSAAPNDTDRVFPRFVFTTPAIEFAKSKGQSTILELLENLLGQAQTQYYQDLLRWMIMKFKEASSLHEKAEEESSTVEITLVEGSGVGRSRGNEFDEDGEQERKRRRHEIAMKQRQRAMEQMQRLQSDFMKNNRALIESAAASGKGVSGPEEEEETEMEVAQLRSDESFPISLGPTKSRLVELGTRKAACVLCQESQEVTFGGRAIVYAAFVQPSTLFSKCPGKVIGNPETHDPLYAPADLYYGILTSTCGHTMHADCWQRFYDNVVNKEQRRPLRWRFNSFFDVEAGEYLCPLCKRLSNTVLPVLPPLKRLNFENSQPADVSYNDWLSGLETAVKAALQADQNSHLKPRAASMSAIGVNLPTTGVLSFLRNRSNSSESSSVSSVEIMDAEPGVGIAGANQGIDETISASVAALADLLPTYNSVVAALTQTMPTTVVEQLSRVWRRLSSLNENAPMSASYLEMLRTFSQAVYAHGLKIHFNDSPRVPVMSWLTSAFTIRCIDACLAFDEKPLFGAFSARQRDCLYAVVRYGAVCNLVSKPAIIRRHLIRLLHPFLTPSNTEVTILDLDLFSTLVELTYAIGWLHADEDDAWTVPIGGVGEYHVFRLVFTAYFLQLLLTIDYDDQQTTSERLENVGGNYESTPDDEDAVVSLIKDIVAKVMDAPAPAVGSPSAFVRRLKCGIVRGFLRPAGLFYHALTHVPPPEALKDPSINEFRPLCRFLGMPTALSEIVTKFLDVNTVMSWCGQPRVRELIAKKLLVRQPLSVNLLIPLPYDFSEMINKAASFTCPSLNSDESRSPTMCLACGTLLCSQTYCCQRTLGDQQVGACTYHAYGCTAGIGVFLKVRDCQVVLQYQQHRGCIMPAPYVDEYGETDPGFRRGNPMRLNQDLYRRLQQCWLQQNVAEQIVNKMELAGAQWMAQEWQHL